MKMDKNNFSIYYRKCTIDKYLIQLNKESLLNNNLKYFCRNLNCSLADLVAAKRGHIKKLTNKLLPEVEFWRVNLIKELINSSLIIELDNNMLSDILKFTCVE